MYSEKDFELVPHTADLKLKVYGKTVQDLFCHALVGMFQSIRPHASGCTYHGERLTCPQLPITRAVHITSFDLHTLLIDFLSEALALSDIYNEAYLKVEITFFSSHEIKALLHGVSVTGFEVVEIKAVTFHDLCIEQLDGIWQTEIVFDI